MNEEFVYKIWDHKCKSWFQSGTNRRVWDKSPGAAVKAAGSYGVNLEIKDVVNEH